MYAFRTALGSRGVIANHGQNDPDDAGATDMGLGEPSPSMYTGANGYGLVALGGAIELQDKAPTDPDWPVTVMNDRNTYKCTEQELFPSTVAVFASGKNGSGTYTVQDLQNWVTLFP